MEINLKDTLKSLRQKKNITQETLANYLGISQQSVGKWERGEGFPDITLLPAIASYYNISIDDLLGVGQIEKEKKLAEYEEKDDELFREGKTAERISLWREAKQEFPNELSVIWNLMYALESEGEKKNADEIIEYGERILNESTDNNLRSGAIQCLSFAYYFGKGDAESAQKYASMAGLYSTTVNQMMPRFLEGNDAVKYCQRNIQELVEMIAHNTDTIVWKGQYSVEDSVKAYKFVIDCFNLLYSDGDYGFYHCRMWEYYKKLADSYLNLGDETEMFSCLEKAAEHSVKYDTRNDGMHTSFMVNKVKESTVTSYKNYTENDSGLLLKYLSNKEYERFSNDPRMQKIVEMLKPIAIM